MFVGLHLRSNCCGGSTLRLDPAGATVTILWYVSLKVPRVSQSTSIIKAIALSKNSIKRIVLLELDLIFVLVKDSLCQLATVLFLVIV